MTTLRPGVRALSITALAAAFSLAGLVALPAHPTAAATATCKVTNATRGATYGRLAAAVKAAKNRDKLMVKGTCTGRTKIVNKRLTIVGVWTKRTGAPTLRSNSKGPVLEIAGDDGTNVIAKRLVIRGDPGKRVGYAGAGILANYVAPGSVRLIDVKIKDLKTKGYGGGIATYESKIILKGSSVIRGCQAASGGGIYSNAGKVVLTGKASVHHNQAEWGGGIAEGHVVMKRRSSIHHNLATVDGGGILNIHGMVSLTDDSAVTDNEARRDGGGLSLQGDGADLTLAGSSSVSGNSAEVFGGGVHFKGDLLTMQDSSSITGNTALRGGGLKAAGWSTLDGVVCEPAVGANVSGNAPDDCDLG